MKVFGRDANEDRFRREDPRFGLVGGCPLVSVQPPVVCSQLLDERRDHSLYLGRLSREWLIFWQYLFAAEPRCSESGHLGGERQSLREGSEAPHPI